MKKTALVALSQLADAVVGGCIGVLLGLALGLESRNVSSAAPWGLVIGLVVGARARQSPVFRCMACALVGTVTIFILGCGCDARNLFTAAFGAAIGLAIGRLGYYKRWAVFGFLTVFSCLVKFSEAADQGNAPAFIRELEALLSPYPAGLIEFMVGILILGSGGGLVLAYFLRRLARRSRAASDEPNPSDQQVSQ